MNGERVVILDLFTIFGARHARLMIHGMRPSRRDDEDSVDYLEFIEAIERGAVDGDNSIDTPKLRSHYTLELDSWRIMRAELLCQVIADAGSVRRASRVLDVPRSTLGAWFRRIKGRWTRVR